MPNGLHDSQPHFIEPAKIKEIQESLPSDFHVTDLTELYSMLCEPTRLKIVFAIKNNELCVQEIAAIIRMSVSAVSHQLRLLKTMRIVRFRKQGKMVYYTLDDSHIEQLLDIGKQHIEE